MDLFSYPCVQGAKARETSHAAARAMRPKAARLQRLVLDALVQYGPMSADECAERLQIDKLSIRPRFSELAAQNRIIDTGDRHPNGSGRMAVVWAIPMRAMAA